MRTMYRFTIPFLLLCCSAVAQEVIILGDDPPPAAATATRRSRLGQTGRAGINTQILVADGRSGNTRAAAPDSVFFDGQRFRLRVSAESEGHLYVLCLNSQGNANVVFPTLDTGAMDSLVGRRGAITIPSAGWFQFDSEPGVERLFLLVSPRPIDDLERAIDDGGELSASLLRRYAAARPTSREDTGAKGILSYTESGLLVRKLELLHESRY